MISPARLRGNNDAAGSEDLIGALQDAFDQRLRTEWKPGTELEVLVSNEFVDTKQLTALLSVYDAAGWAIRIERSEEIAHVYFSEQ